MLTKEELQSLSAEEATDLEQAITLFRSGVDALHVFLRLFRGYERTVNLSVAGVLDPLAVTPWERLLKAFEQENPAVRQRAESMGLLEPDTLPKELFTPLVRALEATASTAPQERQEGIRQLQEGLEQARRCQHLPCGPRLIDAWHKTFKDHFPSQ